MNLHRKIKYVLLLMLLYESFTEAKSKKSTKSTTKLTNSKRKVTRQFFRIRQGKYKVKKQFSPNGQGKYKVKKQFSPNGQGKHKGKKQFFPTGQAQYPSPYPMPQLKPADSVQEVKFVKGFPARYDCTRSKYGCCWDGRTPAHGEAGKGCPQCRDVYSDYCKKTKDLCHFPMVADYCRITCKLCSKNNQNGCQKTQYNCCWDGKTSAKGPNSKGCPNIKDNMVGDCEKFEAECLRNPYYMWTKCRETCLRNLPPIEPYLQMLTQPNSLHHTFSPPYGPPWTPQAHPAMGPSFPYPFPGSPQGNYSVGKKTSARNERKGKL